MAFPATRLRRLRKTGVLRELVRETKLTPADLVYPMFVQLGEGRTPVEAMPGIERLSISHAVEEAGEAHALGIPAVLLFGVPAEKDEQGSGAYDDEGVVQLAVRAIKEAHPELLVITDVCLCALHLARPLRRGARGRHGRQRRHASSCSPRPRSPTPRAGADAVAPSDMMDGRVGALRAQLDAEGHKDLPIVAYSRQVRVRVLRPVPRGGRTRRPRSATGAATRWTRPTPTRPCARRCSTWRRAPTW